MLQVNEDSWKKQIKKRLEVQKKYLDLFLEYFGSAEEIKKAKEFIPNTIYHSVSFSNHENFTSLYEEERNATTKIIRESGWNIWAPYEKTDPGKILKRFEKETKTGHGHSPQEIADIDFSRILTSEALVIDLNLSSNGIGQETQIGFFIPKIVYSRKRPSMLTGGLPGTLPLFYDDFEKLKKIFVEIFSRKSYEDEPFYVKDEHVFKGNIDLNEKYKEELWKWS